MGNGYLSVTRARNVHLGGNLGHQFMPAPAAVTELRDSRIVAGPGTEPINVTNAQDSRLTLENVQVTSPAGQAVRNVAGSTSTIRRVTAIGPDWVNAGKVQATGSLIGAGNMTCVAGGTWEGSRNVFSPTTSPPPGDAGPTLRPLGADLLKRAGSPFPGVGADPAEFQIPPRPVPHPGAGNFATRTVLDPGP